MLTIREFLFILLVFNAVICQLEFWLYEKTKRRWNLFLAWFCFGLVVMNAACFIIITAISK